MSILLLKWYLVPDSADYPLKKKGGARRGCRNGGTVPFFANHYTCDISALRGRLLNWGTSQHQPLYRVWFKSRFFCELNGLLQGGA